MNNSKKPKIKVPPMRDRVSTNKMAEMLGITKVTLYRWEAAKKIPKARRDPMNKYRYYIEDDLRELEKITGRRLRQ
ncbi:MAG: helix-turn-helix domain-containing protein [Elusimicrobiota bacterium]